MKNILILASILLFTTTLFADICGYEEKKKITFLRDGREIVTFDIGIADALNTRARGLMYCSSFRKDKGLLFVFDIKGPKSFWMKNTMIPLGIIFISDDMKVLSVQYGAPFSMKHVDDNGSVKYVLEVNFDEASDIKPDDIVLITP